MATPSPSTHPGDHDRARALHLLTLEFGSRADFDDPRLAYRRLFSEVLGTFLLLLAAAGGGILHAKGQISLAAAVVAPGLTVMAIILFMGAVSGAHLNPVVSLAFALAPRLPGAPPARIRRRPAASAPRSRACSCWRCSATSSTSARPFPVPATTTGRRC